MEGDHTSGTMAVQVSPAQGAVAPIDFNRLLEDENMLREFMVKLGDSLIERTKLSAEVKALREEMTAAKAQFGERIAALESNAAHYRSLYDTEVGEHNRTRVERDQAREALAKSEAEFLAQVEQADQFRRELADARDACRTLREERDQVSAERDLARQDAEHARIEAATLREQNTQMEARIAKMVRALQGIEN